MSDDLMLKPTITPVARMPRWVIGDPGRASAEIGAGSPTGPAGWPDGTVDAAEQLGLELRAASVRGLLHRRVGMARQDSYSLVWREETDELIVTVCDGLGSLDLSHEAADLATRRLAAVLERDAASGLLGWADAFETVSTELQCHADSRGVDMATTVVCACVTVTPEGCYRAELAWIGDSPAYLLTADGWEIVAGSVKTIGAEGGPISSSTSALPSDSIAVQTNTVDFGDGSVLFLMSDGVSDALGAGHGEVGQVLGSWWASPPDQFTFAAQTAFARRSFDDDRTAVGIWSARPEGL